MERDAQIIPFAAVLHNNHGARGEEIICDLLKQADEGDLQAQVDLRGKIEYVFLAEERIIQRDTKKGNPPSQESSDLFKDREKFMGMMIEELRRRAQRRAE